MTPALVLGLSLVMVGTAFLSGVFGMAGGLILLGVLLAALPLPAAMALHAVTQIASNLWRGLLWWRHVQWRAASPYMAGSLAALGAWSLTRYVPDRAVAMLMLGVSPFLLRLLPPGLKPDPERLPQGLAYGGACMTLLLLTGVSGPLVDAFFLGGRMDRRGIVATKAVCQVFGHAAKLLYFGLIIDAAAGVDPLMAALAVGASMLGTTLARRLLERMTDGQFRLWAGRLVTAIAAYYVAHGAVLLWPAVAAAVP
ncbi:sulfite exporter TauE/SafE family protein [Roseomonas nepalensis]|uniref:Probable membrane transporter protein n=1 Tax=Muricoccus nepalensis TaxID=1854500 RepID=A0A502GBI0_9PROT|nr:TSUP family transporter [Roseomonas nepalensis]TPG58063.1 sulfite exporter TauE/SafE family protein [Roseomonas nepalensis]